MISSGGEQGGDGPLHVGDAAPVDAPVVEFRAEGVVIPALLDRHGIHVGVDAEGRLAAPLARDEVDPLAFERQWDGPPVFLGDDDALGGEAVLAELWLDDVEQGVVVATGRDGVIDADDLAQALQEGTFFRLNGGEDGLPVDRVGWHGRILPYGGWRVARARRTVAAGGRGGAMLAWGMVRGKDNADLASDGRTG